MKSLTRNLISAVVIINFISPINGYDIFSTKRLEASQNTKIFQSKDIKFLIQKAEEAEESNSWEKAIEIRKRIIKLIKVNYGEISNETAEEISNLGYLYQSNSQYKKSLPLYKKSLEIYKKIYGLEHPKTALALNDLGMTFLNNSKYKKAKSLLNQSIKIFEKINRDNDTDLAYVLNNLGFLFLQSSEYEKAEPLLNRSLEIFKKNYGLEDEDTVTTINNLGMLYFERDGYEKAEPLLRQSLEIYKKIYGLNNPEIVISLMNLGVLNFNLAQYQKAEQYLNQALEINKKNRIINENSAAIYNHLGLLKIELSQYDEAELLLIKSLEIRKSIYGSKHPAVAESLNNLGTLYADLGNSKKAENFLNKSLKINEEIYEFPNSLQATILNNLGTLYEDLGNSKKAENFLKKSLKISIKNEDISNSASSSNNLAWIYIKEGQFNKAEILLKKALKNAEKFYGYVNPYSSRALNALGFIYSENGDYAKSYSNLKKGITLNSILIQNQASFLPISKRSIYVDSFDYSFNRIYNKNSKSPYKNQIIFFSRLNRHGLLEEIQKKQSQFSKLSEPQKKISDKLRILNQKIAKVDINSKQLKLLISEKEKLEKELFLLIPELKPRIVEINDVSQAMPNDSLLIEFQRYPSFSNNKYGPERYVALILLPSKKEINESQNISDFKIQVVDLGLAEPIDSKIKQALISSEEGLSDTELLWKEVGNMIIKPLSKATEDRDIWFISPDGEINLVPFAALESPNGNGFLSDNFQLRLITTGRELIDLKKESKEKSNISLVVANPSFDSKKNSYDSQKNIPSFKLKSTKKNSTDSSNQKWTSLKYTKKEGLEIAKAINAKLLLENEATSQSIMEISDPKILHIASHSFYIKNKSNKAINIDSGIKSSSKLSLQRFAKSKEPLLRSGIVLAGANQTYSLNDDDGYLTSLEVSKLDWSATEMVVISGCQSGQGVIKYGESIYGLKRAIAIAGARSSLLSLWKVDDEATYFFMKSFYENLKKGIGRAEALSRTQKEFRLSKNKLWRKPYVWAAFQLSGDWRPIFSKKGITSNISEQ